MPTTAAANRKLDRLINRYFENPAAAVAALRAGEIQFTYVESNDVATFKGDEAFKVIEGAVLRRQLYRLQPAGRRSGRIVRVRQAVMHAIDRKAIIESLYGGAAKPANCGYVAEQLVPAGIEPYAYDPAKGQGAAGGGRLGQDQRRQADHHADLLQHAAGRQRHGRRAGDARAGRHQRRAARRRHADLQRHRLQAGNPDCERSSRWSMPGFRTDPNRGRHQHRPQRAQMPPAGANIMRIGMPDLTTALDAALAETDASQARRPLAGRLQGDERQPALGDDVGGQPLWRRLDQAQGLRLDACSGRRTLSTPIRRNGRLDEVGARCRHHGWQARSRWPPSEATTDTHAAISSCDASLSDC